MYTVIKKGLHYVINSFNGKASFELVFTHRGPDRIPVEGVTREAVYAVMIDKIKADDERNPTHENKIQLRHLEAALESQRVVIRNKIDNAKAFAGR
jgi:hypothetical protein